MVQSIATTLAKVNALNSQLNELQLESESINFPVSMVFALNEASQGPLLDTLNEQVATFIQNLAAQKITKPLELALIQTADYARVSAPLKPISELRSIPQLSAFGSELAVAQGLEIAFTMLVSRYQQLKNQEQKVKRPWLILFTDGAGTDYQNEIAAKLRVYSKDKRLIVFIVNVGKESPELAKLSTIEPLNISINQIESMLNWFSESFLTLLKTPQGGVSLSAPVLAKVS